MSSPHSGEAMTACRAAIQLALPFTVLISPLWQMLRNGCASCQVGNVFVEKRWCTMQMADIASGSAKSV